MTNNEVIHVCPHCGSREVPTLIVNKSATTHSGISWRCHACHCSWADEPFRLLGAGAP
jgi:formate dehydrogenase maturation protein FdhE